MIKLISTLAATLVLAGTVHADENRMKAPDGARAYIISPKDGDTVSNPVTIVFGLEGMGVAPAGVEKDKTGHHHLLINTDIDQVDMATGLPATDQIVHFGGGQTQTSVDLPTGSTTLQLLLGDMNHVPFDPPIESDQITVMVK